jgi:ferredoxin-thioredoxin reductase catalytic subunit
MTRKDTKLKGMTALWNKFAAGKDFRLNPDKKHVDMIFKGLTSNEKKYGMRLCPCRLRDGTKETDLKLLCPCNFKAQDIWAKEGRCWCGLFVRRLPAND